MPTVELHPEVGFRWLYVRTRHAEDLDEHAIGVSQVFRRMDLGHDDVRDAVTEMTLVCIVGTAKRLVELLARPEACKDNVHALAGLIDHLLGEVEDANRPSHIENKRLSVATDHGCVDHQLGRLVNRDEEARPSGAS